MSSTNNDLERRIARLEKKYGVTPKPGASLAQRLAKVERAEHPASRTRATGSDLSGEGAELDRRMGLEAPPILGRIPSAGGRVVQLPVLTPAQARAAQAHLASYRTRYGLPGGNHA